MKSAASPAWTPVDRQLDVFLTAFDPSDLPGASVDPLGFERGYLFLADKVLPGLTNAANRPRYLSVLCAGAYLAESQDGSPRAQYEKRLDCVLRFERFWALANVLASREGGEDKWPSAGVRGVTYAMPKAETLVAKQLSRTNADFKLLSRQTPYGVVGLYAAVADGLHLIDRATMDVSLGMGLGENLAKSFLDETQAPTELRRAVREDGDVSVRDLTAWGARAHIADTYGMEEARCLKEASRLDDTRSRMLRILAEFPNVGEDRGELDRLDRIAKALESKAGHADLREAICGILAYEKCSRLVQLGLERLLWVCRTAQSADIAWAELGTDSVLDRVRESLPAAVKRLGGLLDAPTTEPFSKDLNRLADTRQFLELAASSRDVGALVQATLDRHRDVQRGKFDRGRRKLPWLEVNGGRLNLTMTRVGGLNYEATTPDDVAPHPYRLASADAFNEASSRVRR